MNSRASLAVCLLAACVCTAHAAEHGTLVLDEGAYWRYYVQFGPDRLDPAALKATRSSANAAYSASVRA